MVGEVTTTTYSVPMSLPRWDDAPWLPAEDPMDYSPQFWFRAMGQPIGLDGLNVEQRDVLARTTVPGDLAAPGVGSPAVMRYGAFAAEMLTRLDNGGTNYNAVYGIWSTTRQADRLLLPTRASWDIVGFRTYIDVEARLVDFDEAIEPMTLSAEIDGSVGLVGSTDPRPYLTDQWAIYACPLWQLSAWNAEGVAVSQYDQLATLLSTGGVRCNVNADVRAEDFPLGWGDVELGWVSLRVEVDVIDDDTVISYRRTHPRHDGLAGGAGRNYPPSRAIQSSNRIGGGYL